MSRFFPGWTETALQLRAEWLGTCDEYAVVATYENFEREDFFGYWRQLPAPLLFVRGGESPVVTTAGELEVREANPAAEFVTVSRAGHMIPWDNLPEFLEAVRAFRRRVAG